MMSRQNKPHSGTNDFSSTTSAISPPWSIGNGVSTVPLWWGAAQLLHFLVGRIRGKGESRFGMNTLTRARARGGGGEAKQMGA